MPFQLFAEIGLVTDVSVLGQAWREIHVAIKERWTPVNILLEANDQAGALTNAYGYAVSGSTGPPFTTVRRLQSFGTYVVPQNFDWQSTPTVLDNPDSTGLRRWDMWEVDPPAVDDFDGMPTGHNGRLLFSSIAHTNESMPWLQVLRWRYTIETMISEYTLKERRFLPNRIRTHYVQFVNTGDAPWGDIDALLSEAGYSEWDDNKERSNIPFVVRQITNTLGLLIRFRYKYEDPSTGNIAWQYHDVTGLTYG